MLKISVCEMCGSETRLYKAEIEGTMLNVCEHCAKFGKVIASIHDRRHIEKIQTHREKEKKAVPMLSKEELTEGIVEGFAGIIKEKRESLNLKQEDFAKKINEKVSLIHKIETGSFEPDIKLARKIEKFLKIRIVEQKEASSFHLEKTKSDSFTLGDFIRVK